MKKLAIPILLVSLVGISMFFIKNQINLSKNSNKGSVSIRKDDFKAGVKAWEANIIIGNGYDRHDITQMYMRSDRGNDIGGSSALMMILPQGGIYLFSIYFIPGLLLIIHSIIKQEMKKVVLIIALCILFAVTNISYNYFSLLFIAIGWSKINDNYRVGRK